MGVAEMSDLVDDGEGLHCPGELEFRYERRQDRKNRHQSISPYRSSYLDRTVSNLAGRHHLFGTGMCDLAAL